MAFVTIFETGYETFFVEGRTTKIAQDLLVSNSICGGSFISLCGTYALQS